MHSLLDDNHDQFSRSSSCLLPQWMLINSYDKLPHKKFNLTVRKLDGTSFGIEVSRMGTVGDVKIAVEGAFRHLPNRISWAHVWGNFCLCYDGNKLLNDTDYIRMFGIDDGDQLQFIQHCSSTLVRTQYEEDLDLDNEPSISNGHREERQNDEKGYCHRIDIEDNLQDFHTELDNSDTSKRQSTLSNLFSCWFPYRKLSRSQTRAEKRSNSLKVPYSNAGSSKNAIRCYNNNKTCSRREALRGKYNWI